MIPTDDTSFSRTAVRFPSGETECAAWKFLPTGSTSSVPRAAVVFGLGLGAVKEMRLDVAAERFAAAGYVTVVFDYRYFGESGGQPRQLLDPDRQLEDWRAALAYVRSLPEVDPARVAVFGTSFGGGHAIRVAAFDRGVAAAIAQSPFADGPASALALDLRGSAGVSARAIADVIATLRGRPPVLVNLAGKPGEPALMNAPDVVAGLEAIQPDGMEIRNEVAARIALRIPRMRPGRRARDVRCPILFTVCDADSVTPPRATLKWAAQAPKGEVLRYPIGHFDVYLGDAFERVNADQIAFLLHHLPPLG